MKIVIGVSVELFRLPVQTGTSSAVETGSTGLRDISLAIVLRVDVKDVSRM